MLTLDEHYGKLEKRLSVVEASSFGALVVPNGNAATAVHRWYTLKEAFSADLFKVLLGHLELMDAVGLHVLDCFAGSGTTLVSALEDGISCPGRVSSVTGIEQNPFFHLVNRAKLAAYTADRAPLRAFRDEVALGPLPEPEKALPELSTFHDRSYFPGNRLQRLLAYRTVIAKAELPPAHRDLALVALASCVELVSRLRRDGRALRYVPEKDVVNPRTAFVRALDRILEDLGRTSPVRASAVHGDGRRAEAVVTGAVDLAVFSPPYPNNIDYTEVYKMEAWFLGLYESQEDFRDQRLRTVRSHPSIRFEDQTFAVDLGHAAEFDALVSPIVAAIPADRYQAQRQRTVVGYFDDMLRTMNGVARLVRPGGTTAVVVGNSLHGASDESKLLVASDIVIAELGRMVGLEPTEILVARRPARRGAGEPRLRESVVLLRRAA